MRYRGTDIRQDLYAWYIFSCHSGSSATCVLGSYTVQFCRYFPCSPCLHIYSCSVQNDHSYFEVNSLFLRCYCHDKNTHHQTEWVLLLSNMLDPSETGLVCALSMGHTQLLPCAPLCAPPLICLWGNVNTSVTCQRGSMERQSRIALSFQATAVMIF